MKITALHDQGRIFQMNSLRKAKSPGERICLMVICWIVVFLSQALIFSGPLRGQSKRDRAGFDLAAETRIHRPYSPVMVQGSRLAQLVGSRIETLRAYVYTPDQEWKPVPFQVDQVAGDGLLILPLGPEPNIREDNGLLDENDLVVFMAFDAGIAPPDGQKPPTTQPFHEILLRDPASGGLGSVFIINDGALERSTTDYVDYIPGEFKISARNYVVASTKETPAIVDRILVGPMHSGVNIIDRLKLRADAYMFWRLIRIHRDETDLNANLQAYLDGPVRVVRRLGFSINTLFGLPSPEVVRESPSYANHMIFPNDMKVPFRLGLFFTDIKLETGFDFNESLGRAYMYSKRFSEPVLIDGRMDEYEKNLPEDAPSWFVVYGDFGCLIFNILVRRELSELGARVTLNYMDDLNVIDEPENRPGLFGKFGFNIVDVGNVPAGLYRFNVVMHFPDRFRPGVEKDIFLDRDFPLEVDVR